MRLSIGITALTPGWKILFQQIGIPYDLIHNENISSPVLIVSSNNVNKDIIASYINKGGCIITEADIAEEVLSIKTKKLYIKYIYSKSDPVFTVDGICDIYKVCKTAENANHLPNQNNENTVLSIQIGGGTAVIFPSGFISRMVNKKCIRKNFYSESGAIETNERVSMVSKGMIYHHVLSAFIYLFHLRALPFVHLWNFPDGKENLFMFRVDTDFGTPEQISFLYQICVKNSIPAVWFVETKSAQEIISTFSSFKDQEIGLHCFRHRNFKDFRSNLDNIKKGFHLLRNADIKPKGFAAPYGVWNKEQSKAVETLGFEYSSEFCFAYDCLPLYPQSSDVLQVPIHPISSGRLRFGNHNKDEIQKYYFNVIDEKIKLQEPVILYTHPGEENFSLFNTIFEKVNSLQIAKLTFAQYSEWWKKRISVNWNPELKENGLLINSDNIDVSIWCKVHYPNNRPYISPVNNINKKIDVDNVILEKEFKKDPKELRNYSFRMFRHDLLSKYRKLKQ